MTAPDATRAPAGPVTSKLRSHHLERLAIVYVRQSTPRQVAENRESTDLQYQLAQRAAELGWRADRVLVIDDDLGHSAASAADRVGFQRLLAEVGLNHVGLILGSEMSRLARSCRDWYQLLELCSLFQVLLADADGVYDPTDPNDRMLLGLRGMMSEAELHVLRSRLLQGKRNKAGRGELFASPPVGYVRPSSGEPALDPDEQVRGVVRLIFDKFAELGSVRQVVLYLRRHAIRLPIRPCYGPNRGLVEWRDPVPATVYNILSHPMYAGAYCYGRSRVDPRLKVPGRRYSGTVRRRDGRWQVLIRDRLPAYITWAQYEANRQRLRQNRSAFEATGSPRPGSALLSGLVACARCGWRMYVHYRDKPQAPRYACSGGDPVVGGERRCPGVTARVLDGLVSRLALQALRPASVELSVTMADDLRRETERLETHWQQRLERARFEAERARRQYDAAEPENRLVARELERRWEDALRQVQQLSEDYARCRDEWTASDPSDDEQARVRELSSDIPALWQSAAPDERKEILRLLVERVEVEVEGDSEQVVVSVRWAGGGVSRHRVTRPVGTYERLHDFDRLLARIRELRAAGQRSSEIAEALNAEGFHSPRREQRFTADRVRQIVSRCKLRPRPAVPEAYPRLGPGERWMTELADELGVPIPTMMAWCRRGWACARKMGGDSPRWVVWADDEEKERLRQLGAGRRGGAGLPYPAELTTPKGRPVSE